MPRSWTLVRFGRADLIRAAMPAAVGGRRGGAEEGAKPRGQAYVAVGRGQVRLLQGGAPVGPEEEVARGDGRAVRVVEDLARPVGAKGLRRVADPVEGSGTRPGAVPVGGRHGDGVRARVVAKGGPVGGDAESAPFGVHVQGPGGRGGGFHQDETVPRGGAGVVGAAKGRPGNLFEGILGAVLDGDREAFDGGASTVQDEEVVIVGAGPQRGFSRRLCGTCEELLH